MSKRTLMSSKTGIDLTQLELCKWYKFKLSNGKFIKGTLKHTICTIQLVTCCGKVFDLTMNGLFLFEHKSMGCVVKVKTLKSEIYSW